MKLDDEAPQYDALILIMLCIVVRDAFKGYIWYYDERLDIRHFRDLQMDILPRINISKMRLVLDLTKSIEIHRSGARNRVGSFVHSSDMVIYHTLLPTDSNDQPL